MMNERGWLLLTQRLDAAIADAADFMLKVFTEKADNNVVLELSVSLPAGVSPSIVSELFRNSIHTAYTSMCATVDFGGPLEVPDHFNIEVTWRNEGEWSVDATLHAILDEDKVNEDEL